MPHMAAVKCYDHSVTAMKAGLFLLVLGAVSDFDLHYAVQWPVQWPWNSLCYACAWLLPQHHKQYT